MASGWAPDGAVQEQIDDTVDDGVQRARARLVTGEGEGEPFCVECGEEIPAGRRRALPGVRTCVACQTARDRQVVHTLINRRGSKDSQLK